MPYLPEPPLPQPLKWSVPSEPTSSIAPPKSLKMDAEEQAEPSYLVDRGHYRRPHKM